MGGRFIIDILPKISCCVTLFAIKWNDPAHYHKVCACLFIRQKEKSSLTRLAPVRFKNIYQSENILPLLQIQQNVRLTKQNENLADDERALLHRIIQCQNNSRNQRRQRWFEAQNWSCVLLRRASDLSYRMLILQGTD